MRKFTFVWHTSNNRDVHEDIIIKAVNYPEALNMLAEMGEGGICGHCGDKYWIARPMEGEPIVEEGYLYMFMYMDANGEARLGEVCLIPADLDSFHGVFQSQVAVAVRDKMRAGDYCSAFVVATVKGEIEVRDIGEAKIYD